MGGKVVFVGNISYDITEQQLIDIFSEVGPVQSFRLVFDKDTGRPKGYGFCEYHDEESAASAVRNLNNHVINNRNLRVDFTHDSGSATTSSTQQANVTAPAPGNDIPPLPAGQPAPPNMSVTDAIGKTLSTIPPHTLMDVLTQLKGVVMSSPDQAELLLKQSPQLAYAVFQAMLLMDVVDAQILTKVIASNPSAPPQGQAKAPQPPPQSSTPSFPPQYGQPTPPPILPPQSFPRQPYQNFPAQTRTPPLRSTPQPQPSMPGSGAPINQALIQQVMSLSDAQINALPPQQRQVILGVKQRILSGQM